MKVHILHCKKGMSFQIFFIFKNFKPCSFIGTWKQNNRGRKSEAEKLAQRQLESMSWQ